MTISATFYRYKIITAPPIMLNLHQGAIGQTGPPGPPGNRGASGQDGRNGADGQDGAPGTAGDDGLPGTPGPSVSHLAVGGFWYI